MYRANIERFFDSDTGKVLLEGLLNSVYGQQITEKLLKTLNQNATGRSAREIKTKVKIEEKIAKDVFMLGEQLFIFYCKKIAEGWTLTDDMLLQAGIAHRDHPRTKILRDVGRLNSIIFLREKLSLTQLLDSYIELILGLIYPPQAGLFISKVTAQVTPLELYIMFSRETPSKKVQYLGEEATLALSRAIGILNVTPLGEILKKEFLS